MPLPGTQPPALKALILDDNTFDRKRLRRMARQTGIDMEFVDVPSLIAFKRQLDLDHYQLVFIDYRLPEGNGLEALHILRQNTRNKDTAAIVVAAELEQGKVEEAFRAGCSNYIAKQSLNTKMLRYMAISALENQDRHFAAPARLRPADRPIAM